MIDQKQVRGLSRLSKDVENIKEVVILPAENSDVDTIFRADN